MAAGRPVSRQRGRIARLRRALTPAEWRRAGGLAAAVLGLHLVGFGLLFALVVPAAPELGNGGVFGVGLGITAYTLGLRHAFDADHIGAIDNTTRKLMSRRPAAARASASSSRSATRRSSSCSPPRSRSGSGG